MLDKNVMSSKKVKKVASKVAKLPKHALRVPGKRSKAVGGSFENKQEERSHLLADGQPDEVPQGFMAVYVGQEQRRFVIPTKFLSVPDFVVIMDKTAEEFGYEQEGGLRIPCDEQDFERLLASCCQVI